MERQIKYSSKTKLALDTWVKLARANSAFTRKVKEDIRNHGLTVSQLGIIEALMHKGPMTINKLCSKLLLTGGNMTLVLDNMEKKKLVKRVYDKNDRRAIFIHLTKEGEKAFNEYFPAHAEFIADLMSVLSKDEQKTLGELLKKLGTSLSEEEE